MSGTRRAILRALGGAGMMLAAGPAFAEDNTAPAVGWSGVTLTLSGNIARIADLDPLGPAARAGLRPGDVVIGCDGGGLDRLGAALAGPPAALVDLAVRRGAASRNVRLVLEEQESARP